MHLCLKLTRGKGLKHSKDNKTGLVNQGRATIPRIDVVLAGWGQGIGYNWYGPSPFAGVLCHLGMPFCCHPGPKWGPSLLWWVFGVAFRLAATEMTCIARGPLFVAPMASSASFAYNLQNERRAAQLTQLT